MQQYNVPQFVEVEDTIFGPLTLRQFLAVLAGGILIMGYYAIFKYSPIFWLLSVPTGLIALFIALASLNGRPVMSYVFPMIAFITKPKKRLFHREPTTVVIKAKKQEMHTNQLEPQEVQSRLKRLAYVLDQRSQAEEQLVENLKRK